MQVQKDQAVTCCLVQAEEWHAASQVHICWDNFLPKPFSLQAELKGDLGLLLLRLQPCVPWLLCRVDFYSGGQGVCPLPRAAGEPMRVGGGYSDSSSPSHEQHLLLRGCADSAWCSALRPGEMRG